MPDVVAKLDEQGVDLLVQPEFFVNDTVRTEGMWAPDQLKAAGYSDVLRSPGIEAMVLPELTGNVYDFSADAQQQIAVKPRGARVPAGYLVGQPPARASRRWRRGSCRSNPPGEPLAARRARLGRAGEAMLPVGDGPACPSPRVPGPCRGGQVESVLWRDVQVARRPRYRPRRRAKLGATPLPVNRPLAPSRSSQRNVSLAARGNKAWAVFEQRRGGRAQILLVRSRDGGRTWSAPLSPAGGRPGRARNGGPASPPGRGTRVGGVAGRRDRRSARLRRRLARRRQELRPGARDRRLPAARGGPVAPEHRGDGPHVGGRRLDRRARALGRRRPPAGARVRRSPRAATAPRPRRRRVWTRPRPSSSRPSSTTPGLRTSRPAGRVAVDVGRLPQLRLEAVPAPVLPRRRRKLGAGAAAVRRPVAVARDAEESLDDAPSVALGPGGRRVLPVDFRKRAPRHAEPHQLYDVYLGSPGRASVQVDPWGSRQLDSFNPAAVLAPGGGLLVAWQDARRGAISDVPARRVDAPGGSARARVRVDDRGAGTTNALAPRVCCAGGASACWRPGEDERDGPPQIFAATATRCPRARAPPGPRRAATSASSKLGLVAEGAQHPQAQRRRSAASLPSAGPRAGTPR